jgi:hypothetical protein
MTLCARIEFPDAPYNIAARGGGPEDADRVHGDQRMLLGLLADVCERFDWWGTRFI